MKRFIALASLATILTSGLCFAHADSPEPAQPLLEATITKAKTENKSVFLSFHASWCGWCHRLEDFLNDEKVKPIVAKHLEVLWLDCQEREGKKNLENPGVDAILEKYGASQTGLPTMFVIDGEGKTVASSIRKQGGNIGYPGEPDEIVHFLSMLKKAGFTAEELQILEDELKIRASKIKH